MTEPREHPVDELLRAVAGNPEPSPIDRQLAEQKLDRAIDDALPRSQLPYRRPVLIWAASALAAGIAVFVVLGGRPSPVQASMEEIAGLVETLDPLVATDTTYIYTRSTSSALTEDPEEALGGIHFEGDSLFYLTNSTREAWYSSQGTVQIRTTYHPPTFFSEADSHAYYAAGLDQRDQIGQTITDTVVLPVEEWPSDPDQLDQAIRGQMVTDRGLPQIIEYFDVTLDIIGESFATPQVSAAALRLIAGLDGVKLAEETAEASTFTVDYTTKGIETRLNFTIDHHGYLRYHQILNLTADNQLGLPANTPTYEAEFARPTTTNTLD